MDDAGQYRQPRYDLTVENQDRAQVAFNRLKRSWQLVYIGNRSYIVLCV